MVSAGGRRLLRGIASLRWSRSDQRFAAGARPGSTRRVNFLGSKFMKFIEFFRRGNRAPAGRSVYCETTDRECWDVSRYLEPAKVDAIMQVANSGDPRDQARLIRELTEKYHGITHGWSVRSNALCGVDFAVTPGDSSRRAKLAAEALEDNLRNAGGSELKNFAELIRALSWSLMTGYAAAEIVWQPGGLIDGFVRLPPETLTFVGGEPADDASRPRLVTSWAPGGVALAPDKFIVHTSSAGDDPARGGLVRPLAWLACFAMLGQKGALAFCERYGMPFLAARIDETTWQNERGKLQRIIKAFGPSGGGVITKGVELELLQTTSSGDIFFKLLDYWDRAVERVLLGQTASGGDGGGLSKNDAQSKVRQDLLESDATGLAGTLNAQLIEPWMRYNFGDGVARPRLVFDVVPPEDQVAKYDAKKAKYDAMGVAIRAGILTATPEIERVVREDLGLPPMSDAALADWEAGRGVRLPITLKQEAPPGGMPPEALAMSDAPEEPDDDELEPLTDEQRIMFAHYLAPFDRELAALLDDGDDEAIMRRLPAALERLRCDDRVLADYLLQNLKREMRS